MREKIRKQKPGWSEETSTDAVWGEEMNLRGGKDL